MTYYSALHYAAKAEKSANLAEQYATQATQFSGKVIQIGFDGFMENGQLVFKHSPAGVDTPYDLLDDYEYEIDMVYQGSDLAGDVELVVKNGADTINFVSALHRDSTTPVTVKDMKSVMRYDESTGYRWLFKAAFKITPLGDKVLLLYPVISIGGSGTGRNIGDIFYTSRLDDELNGAVEADGTIYSVEAFTGEQSVPALLAEGKLPSVSMAEYESIVSANGSCRAWGWDNGDTFRVPLLKDVYLMAGQAESAGEFISESLPNITGEMATSVPASYEDVQKGALYAKTFGDSSSLNMSGGSAVNKTAGTVYGFRLNASRSSSTYQDGAKVRPDSVRYRAMVQLSTGVKEDATQLKEYKFNNPHFFGQSMWSDVEPKNGSWLVSNGNFHLGATYVDYYKWLTDIKSGNKTVEGVSVKSVDDEYTDYDWVVNTADSTFRLPLKTKLASGSAVAGNGMTLGLYDGTSNYGAQASYADSFSISLDVYGTPAGTTANTINGINKTVGVTTDPEKSGIETSSNGLKLYFYVGDTVQDASLINAGAVLSDVADSIKRSSAVDRETVVGWGMPDYSAGVVCEESLNVEKTYTAPKDGIIIYGLSCFGDKKSCYIKLNGVQIMIKAAYSTYGVTGLNGSLPVNKGDVVTYFSPYNNTGYDPQNIVFYPLKGVN